MNPDDAGASDRAFALLQELLPQHLLSRTMHRLARSQKPALRDLLVRGFLKAYPNCPASTCVANLAANLYDLPPPRMDEAGHSFFDRLQSYLGMGSAA